MSYELYTGPEIKGCRTVALIDPDTQTPVIEGRWKSPWLSTDTNHVQGVLTEASVERYLRLWVTKGIAESCESITNVAENDGIACVPQDITFNGKPVRQGDHIRVTRTFPGVTELTLINDQDLGAVPDSKPALATQVGGSHYKDMPIQPAEYCHRNGIGKLEGDVIAYVSRWHKKNGIEDLKKARHTIDIIIELEGEQ